MVNELGDGTPKTHGVDFVQSFNFFGGKSRPGFLVEIVIPDVSKTNVFRL